jgi:tRNA (mo5U34)-methyltransferase
VLPASPSLRERVEALPWYHTLALGEGVVTPGVVDTRAVASRLPLPASLSGARCLDVGTQNGFWAFELERRGAEEVVGVDLPSTQELDWAAQSGPAPSSSDQPDERQLSRRAFDLAREQLSSSVQWRGLSVYDLSADAVGTFDLVFVGSLLVHLRDPIGALERVRSVCRGEAVIFDVFDPIRTLAARRRPLALLRGRSVWWWIPNRAALERMAESAGWEVVGRTGLIFVPPGEGFSRPPWRRAFRAGALELLTHLRGAPHLALRIRPRE